MKGICRYDMLDNNAIVFIAVIVLILVVLTIYGITSKSRETKRLYNKIISSYGKMPENEYLYEKYESIGYYYRVTHEQKVNGKDYCNIDDITWHDLDLDSVYLEVNNTQSSIGEEYLYGMMRTPALNPEIIDERNRLINFFGKNKELRTTVQVELARAGKLNNISVYEYISRLKNLKSEDNITHYAKLVMIIAAIALIFIEPAIGILSTVVMFFVNVVSYFKRKGEIEKYYSVVSYMLRTIDTAKTVSALNINAINVYTARLKELDKSYGSILKGGRIIVSKKNGGDILETFMDYIRMASHIDLIRFNNMLNKIKNKEKEFQNIFETLGFLDAVIAIASYRSFLGCWCEPDLSVNNKGIKAEAVYHPLINDPVKNNFCEDKSVLLTGSNASGKSTFIKTMAINSILAQTIVTVAAGSFSAPFYKCMTSMALSDNLSEGESYYIVEIKSLKRICDALNDEVPLLVFIDEVLRGTNTLERIAASSQILKYIAERNCLLFAATHDIELTQLLKDYFELYHFEERVKEKSVVFDYKLKPGPTTTRNAIKLLNMLGFEEDIIDKATKQADEFSSSGEWRLS